MQLDEKLVQEVWEKGRVIPGRNPEEWRQDQCGAWLRRDQYDNGQSEFGWKALKTNSGGKHATDELQPFHWKNVFDIATGRPNCKVMADRTDVPAGQQVYDPRNTGL